MRDHRLLILALLIGAGTLAAAVLAHPTTHAVASVLRSSWG
jgi:hypothetical protein